MTKRKSYSAEFEKKGTDLFFRNTQLTKSEKKGTDLFFRNTQLKKSNIWGQSKN